MATSTIQISQLTLATPVAADSVAGANAAGAARRYTVGSLGTAHTHDASSISAGVLDLARVPTHTHSIAQVSGLQTSLDGKAALAATNVLRVETLNGLNGAVTIEASSGITVATQGSKITISAASATAAVSSVNGATGAVVLTSQSVSAASAVHTHVSSSITDFAAAVTAANIVRSLNGITGAVVLTHTSVSAASATHASQHRAGGADVVLPVTTSTSITASVNNLTLPVGDIIRLSSTATGTAVITGLSGGAANQVRLLCNVSTNAIRLAHASSDSGATNRFIISGGADLDLAEGAQASAWYDADTGRWRVAAGSASPGGGSTAAGGIVSVNGITATAITLTSASVSAASAVHTHVAANVTDFATEAAKYGPVESVNSATGPITIAAGSNITVDTKANQSTSGSTITISAAGGGGIISVNGQTATAITLTADSVTAASTAHMTTHRAGGSDEFLPLVTAVSLTASVNNYSLPTGDVFRLSHTTTNTVNITGFGTAVDGSSRLLINVSTGASSSYTIKHQNTNSTAVSRVIVPWEGDYVVSPNGGAALIIYDDTDDRWRVV